MPFSSATYHRLDSSKYCCTEDTDGDLQTNRDVEDDDEELDGYSLDFSQPKDSFMSELRRGCGKMGQKFAFVLKMAFGKWPIALFLLLCYIGLTVGLVVIALTGKYHEFRKDISLNSFMVPDIKVSSDFAAFNTAKDKHKLSIGSFENFLTAPCTENKIYPWSYSPGSHRVKRDHFRDDDDERSGTQRTLSWTLDLVYVAKNDNIFTKENLQEIHKIEQSLMKHEGYDKHCFKSTFSLKDNALRRYANCTPPNSMINFFFPSHNGKLMDGQGEHLIRPIQDTLQFLQSKKYFFSYVSDDFNKRNGSKILRAQLLFGRPVKGISSGKPAQKEEFRKYVRTYINTLDQLNNNNQVSVLYGGGDLFDYLVNEALMSDIRLAAISLGLIVLLLLILTFSWWLSLMAVLTILSSVGLAYFFYRVVFGIKYMGILNGVSLFVILGIGVDDIFVFINTFRQAVDNKDLGNRILHTIHVAGKATFFTSFTTACAFGANALSPIPAIHDFGLFMAILVASCWVSVLFIMSPSLTLWHAGIERLESAMCKKVMLAIGLKRSGRLRLPADIRRFLSGVSNNSSDDDNRSSETEAIPLMNNNDDHDNDDDDDDDLLVLDCESPSTQTINVTDSIGFRLQSILYHFVAEPIVKGRVVIFVTYFFLLVGSAFLLSKLKVSTDQPKFFKADSNLQRWLELPDVSLQRSTSMLEDIEELENSLVPGLPDTTRKPKPIKRPTTRRKVKKSTTSLPQRPTKPSSRAIRRTFSTKPRKLSTREYVSTTELRTTLSTMLPSTLSTSTKETTSSATRPGSTIKTTQRTQQVTVPTITRWTSTFSSNATRTTLKKKPHCPKCVNGGVCNNASMKCVCQFPYTGETCSKSCPIKTMNGDCCEIPFRYKNLLQYGCLIDQKTGKPWCSLSNDFDKNPLKGECNMTVQYSCPFRTQTPNKTCCYFPFYYKMLKYFTCIPQLGKKGLYCGIQPQVSADDELVPCLSREPTAPPLCSNGRCTRVKAPLNDATAIVYVVFGIKGIDRTSVDLRHVLKETQGNVILDSAFAKAMNCDTEQMIKSACSICKKFSNNKELVRSGGAECFPDEVNDMLASKFPNDCQDLPSTNYKKVKSIIVLDFDNRVQWLAMAFSSTTGKLASFGSQKDDYQKWEDQLQELLKDAPDSMKRGFQTSETWVTMFSGVIVVDSAVYGIVVSLLLCLAAVIIFTGHVLLFIVLLLTILGVLLMVTAIFYLTGWQLGGVEAISLSILVGTSVDYCFHLVEGYILAGDAVDPALDNMCARQWRAKAAMSHIGMSIISSALTTILAAIPLCLTQIQLFAKFGLIVTINTGISLLYTVAVTMAMLSIFGPPRYRARFVACVKGFIAVAVLGGVGFLVLYLISTQGHHCIDSPSGTSLFKC